MLPGTVRSVQFSTDNAGFWLMHCHVADHITAGMKVRGSCPSPGGVGRCVFWPTRSRRVQSGGACGGTQGAERGALLPLPATYRTSRSPALLLTHPQAMCMVRANEHLPIPKPASVAVPVPPCSCSNALCFPCPQAMYMVRANEDLPTLAGTKPEGGVVRCVEGQRRSK